MHYRVDLSKGEYCFGKCEQTLKISEITSGTITIFDKQPSPPENARSYNRINRSTGEWEWYSFYPKYDRTPEIIKGVCKPMQFSGFPEARF